LEVHLPAWLAILLGLFWLAVLVTLAFTVWRLLGNLKALSASVAELNRRLTPTLEELAAKSEQAAELSARLEARSQRMGRSER
jgi:uncharacterized protein involved in exopolysaccharide biosynthesis